MPPLAYQSLYPAPLYPSLHHSPTHALLSQNGTMTHPHLPLSAPVTLSDWQSSGFHRDALASAEGAAAPSTTLTGSIRTSKITGCLRLQPTGFDTSNHAAKVLQTQNPLSVFVTFRHFPSRFGVICHFPSLFVTYCYFPILFSCNYLYYKQIRVSLNPYDITTHLSVSISILLWRDDIYT